MSSSLSQTEIAERLIRLRNLERLYGEQKRSIAVLEDLVKALKEENRILKKINDELRLTLEGFKLQIEELRAMVFGKKKQKKEHDDDDFIPPKEKAERNADSYKRPIPQDTEVTETKNHPIDACTHCQRTLFKKKTIVFFEEEILIPVGKIIRKHIVEKGYCTSCKKWQTAIPLPAGKAVLGGNVQKYICYLSVVCRLSYSQTRHMLFDSYHISISEGEVAKILNREAIQFRPEYERLKEKIRGESAIHLDETGWKILCGGDRSYAWVMSGATSSESVFLVGETRGCGNVETLRGQDYKGITVTDDYGAYKTLKNHQLCWSHLIRKFRDFANSHEMTEEYHVYYVEQYKVCCEIFLDLKQYRNVSLFDSYAKRLAQLAVINPLNCKKMIRIKTTLLKNIPKYLTCLSDPDIPLTNNQAERSLRHLVLKRKISFGSLTKRTADNLAILLSVLLSRRQRNPANWFGEWVGV
jgi:hypothetical protein